jgi:hypothetical protein
MRSRSRALTVHSLRCDLRVLRASSSCICAKILGLRCCGQMITEVLIGRRRSSFSERFNPCNPAYRNCSAPLCRSATDLLQIYTDGHNNLRPRIAWFAPNVPRVTVANLSHIEMRKRHVDGVDVDIQYDPDDPPARAAWLKRTGRTPD